MNTNAEVRHFDVVISGAGFVGKLLAIALADAGIGPVAIIDPADAAGRAVPDRRSSALSASAVRMLDTLDIWPDLADLSQPILSMDITDSELEEPTRPAFLTFDTDAAEDAPFAHMVPNRALFRCLDRALAEAPVARFSPRRIVEIDGASPRCVTLDDGTRMIARILVGADGAGSPTRHMIGLRTVGWDYDQIGLVAEIDHELAHGGRAEEHFLPSGPFAILPLRGNRSSLVWTERAQAARVLLAHSPDALADALRRRIPPHYGTVSLNGFVQSFPLRLMLVRDYVAPGFALVGDAAHVIHPLAGQGLNLGLRDIAALAEVVVDAIRLGLDPGSVANLERYQRWRRFDATQMAAITDGLNRLFALNLTPVRMLRDVGMGLVDRFPRLKTTLIDEAAGLSGDLPRLMRGELL